MWRELIALWRSDDLLEEAWRESHRMLEIAQEMLAAATTVLRHSPGQAVAADVRARDAEVDAFEQDVRRKVLTHCAVRGGSALPGGMALVSIVSDIERIGDYIRHMVDLAANYPGQLDGGPFAAELQRVETAVSRNLERTCACVESSDAREAARILEDYAWVKGACYERIMAIIRDQHLGFPPGQAAALVLYLRWLKRINAHLLGITTTVVSPLERSHRAR